MTSYEVARYTPQELKDLLGWSESADFREHLMPVVMALCDRIAALERRLATLGVSP